MVKGTPRRAQPEFPYITKFPLYGIRFHINNAVEQFRLRDWGGEKDYALQMNHELRDDDIFFDIGASVGLNSVLAASKLKHGMVISFEPDPENAFRLKENYRLNNLNNYVIKQIAVGDQNTTMKLYTNGSKGYSPSLKKVNYIDNYIKVNVNTIDSLIDKGKIPYPTVVKIDIEGAELMALHGMQNLLKSIKRPRLLFMEIHPEFLKAFNATSHDVFELLSKLDYSITEEVQRHNQVLCRLVRK